MFTISENTDIFDMLLNALKEKENFYLVVNYTINSNFYMPSAEMDFIDELLKKLNTRFKFKRFEILNGRGIIVRGERK